MSYSHRNLAEGGEGGATRTVSWGGGLDMALRQLMEQDAEVEALTSRNSEHGPGSTISVLDS